MGLFSDLFSKKNSTSRSVPARKRVADMSSIPVDERQHYLENDYYAYRPYADTAFDDFEVIEYNEQIKTVKPTSRGLYPPEIVMLYFCKKYPLEEEKKYPAYWWFEYGVINAKSLLDTLEEKGLIRLGSKGKYEPTEEGGKELIENEAIVWAHRKKAIGSAWDMARLLDGHMKNWKDVVWRTFEEQKVELLKQGQLGLYRNVFQAQAEFAEYEKKYGLAIKLYDTVTELDKKDQNDPKFEGYPGTIRAIERCERALVRQKSSVK